jgi:hypothetical protein
VKQMGYFFLDHRASPGLTEQQARQAGYDPSLVREGKVFEADSLTCSHCQSVVIKSHFRQRERAKCVKCNHYICDGCHYLTTLPDYVHATMRQAVEYGKPELVDGIFPQVGVPTKLIP